MKGTVGTASRPARRPFSKKSKLFHSTSSSWGDRFERLSNHYSCTVNINAKNSENNQMERFWSFKIVKKFVRFMHRKAFFDVFLKLLNSEMFNQETSIKFSTNYIYFLRCLLGWACLHGTLIHMELQISPLSHHRDSLTDRRTYHTCFLLLHNKLMSVCQSVCASARRTLSQYWSFQSVHSIAPILSSSFPQDIFRAFVEKK